MITDEEIRQQSEDVIARAMKIGARILLNTVIIEGTTDVDDLSARIEAWQPRQEDRRIP